MVMLLFCKYPGISNARIFTVKKTGIHSWKRVPFPVIVTSALYRHSLSECCVLLPRVLLVFIYHFFDKAKHYRNYNAKKKSQSQANGSRVFIFNFWWAYSYTAITVRIHWPVPGQVYHFCIKLTVNCWRRLYLIENLPAIMIFWRIPFDNRRLHARYFRFSSW